MRVRSALGALAAGVGGLSGINAVLNRYVDSIDPALSGEHNTLTWSGIDISYTEAGDPTDHTLVLLHGINAAGSNGEFRRIFTALAESYHVVAPDLPGFGTSDRPHFATQTHSMRNSYRHSSVRTVSTQSPSLHPRSRGRISPAYMKILRLISRV